MNMPFTAGQFLGVFEKYNLAIWPMQVIAHLLGIAAVLLTICQLFTKRDTPTKSSRLFYHSIGYGWGSYTT